MSALHVSPSRLIPPRSRLSHFAVLATIAGALAFGACGQDASITITSTPALTDVVEAVRRSADGRTYTDTVWKEVARTRTCSQMDVDFDPFMPHNPELAKCPFVGATYNVWESVPTQETGSCPSLPEADQPGWYVEQLGEGRWRVSRGSSTWDVDELAGGAAKMEGTIEVSGFLFTIEADQAC